MKQLVRNQLYELNGWLEDDYLEIDTNLDILENQWGGDLRIAFLNMSNICLIPNLWS
jgi:hypothetical protein